MATVNFNRKPESNGFRLLPEGDQNLRITAIEGIPRANVTQVTVDFVSEDGIKFKNRYDLTNEFGYNAFYYLVNNGCGFDLDGEFDINACVGKFVVLNIVHKKGTKEREDGTFPTFVNVKYVVGAGEPFGDADVVADDDTDEWDD